MNFYYGYNKKFCEKKLINGNIATKPRKSKFKSAKKKPGIFGKIAYI